MITNIHKYLNLDGREHRRASVYLFGIFHLYEIEEVRELTFWEGFFCSVRWTYSALADREPIEPVGRTTATVSISPRRSPLIGHGGDPQVRSAAMPKRRGRMLDWCLERGGQAYDGFEYVRDFLHHALTKCYTKGREDTERIAANPLVRIAIFVGLTTTGVIFIKAIEQAWPLWMDVFLIVQFARICVYLGSAPEIEIDQSEPQQQVMFPGEEDLEDEREREYADGKEWVPQRDEYNPYA